MCETYNRPLSPTSSKVLLTDKPMQVSQPSTLSRACGGSHDIRASHFVTWSHPLPSQCCSGPFEAATATPCCVCPNEGECVSDFRYHCPRWERMWRRALGKGLEGPVVCREGVAEMLGVRVVTSASYAGPLWKDSWSQRCSSEP